MAAKLAALYVVCHGLVLVLLPGHAALLSFCFLIGAPLLAALACSGRMLRSGAWVGWLAVAVGMVLWAAGMALNLCQDIGTGNADATPGASMLLYVLYGVPLTFAMAHPQREPWYLLLIDGALAVLLGYLFFVHTFSFATLSDAPAPGINSLRLMFDIENLFIAVFALVRYLASENAARRVFFRALSLYAWAYLAVAAYINHVATDASYGGMADLLIDLPFLLLAVAAWQGGTERVDHAPRRLALVVRAGSPLILPAALLVVSALLVGAHPHLAVVGFALATLGSGLRGVVMQVRALEGQDQLDVLARVDALTGVANRRQFDQVLKTEWARARRSGHGMALLMVDIDHFKQFNDRFGHLLGDACLRAVATTLTGCATRGSDVVARYGGEEFAVVVADTSRDGALALADTLRNAVAQLRLVATDPATHVGVTISIGVAHVACVTSPDPAALLAASDAALYAAKRAGRNRVVEGTLTEPG
ncbi:GGDEF domain-containing protein [Bacillus subtilis subsp. subtilis]|nr:GGDEF domain-containing protein [Bacillus subtilis subsp. subtilis]